MITKNRNNLSLKLILAILFLMISNCMGLSQYERQEYSLTCHSSYWECNELTSNNSNGYYRSYRYYRQPGNYRQVPPSYRQGGSHTPFHIPAGRFHNLGRPSHWKL
ncbi:hypothetical protein [Leptospira sarikeiensis]|uniref:Uncharacterized protein n=1 Tax=Leptospira sarikeiensis TaxID=2484943 RepID=A0A4R9JYP2_9LEPT|nr:hypothetical protein [Leptospira sarikeiensis]TGL58361.1 hypothetical protein EHQ64_18920 [Leptospira sarikeiensis]